MTPKEEIKEYLKQDSKDRDYNEGFNLFCRYSKNQAVQTYLARKNDREKLFYKLEQLLLTDIRESKTPMISVITRAVNKTEVNEVEVRLSAATKGKINPDDLPAELKPLYDQVSEAHKKSRSLHEKLKIAKTDKARKGLRKELLAQEDFVRAGWTVLDHWAVTGELPAVEDPKEITTKDVTAARTFLSRGLKTLETISADKKPELVAELKSRYDILIAAKSEFAPKTIEILTKHGVIESREASN